MSRARAVRAAHLQCLMRHSGLLVENGATGKFSTTSSSQSCLQLSRLVPNSTSPGESRQEFFSEDGPQRGILSNSQLASKSRSTYSSQLQGIIFTRSFSQVLPEKEMEPGRTEEASSVLQTSEEVTSTDVEVNTDPSKDTNVLVSGLQQETTLVDEDAENDDDSEDEAGPELTPDKITALWKKIEKVSRGSKRAVIPLLKEWIAEGNTLDRDTLVTILVKLKRRSRYKQAMEISDYMSENKGYKWEPVDQVMRIDLKFKLRQFRSADAIFEKSPPEYKSEGAYNTLIRNYSEHHMVKKAEALFSELKKLGICTSPFAFNQMLLLYKRRRMEEKVPGVLKDMEAAKIARDSYTYNILMDIKSQTGDLEGMEEVFEAMKADEKIQPDAATYGTLATAYIAANQPLKAKEYLEVMESGDFPRSYTAYDILLAQYGVMGDVEGVERIWKQLKSHPYTSNRSYVVAIEAFGDLKQIDKAEEIYMELENKGSVLTSQYNALLKAYSNAGMTDKADALLAKMVTAKRKRNAVTYHNIIVGHLKQNELEKALDALKKLKLDALHGRTKVWLETLLAILEEISKQGDIVRAEKLFQDIKKEYPKSNTRTYNILLKSYANAKVPAGGFLQRMAADNVEPSDETHSLLQKSGFQV